LVDRLYSYDEAREIVLSAMKPLGEDYVNYMKKAFADRWIDEQFHLTNPAEKTSP